LVVWECELSKQTTETIQRVATWLQQGYRSSDTPHYNNAAVSRSELLAVAEERVRFRIASYTKIDEPIDSNNKEDGEP